MTIHSKLNIEIYDYINCFIVIYIVIVFLQWIYTKDSKRKRNDNVILYNDNYTCVPI